MSIFLRKILGKVVNVFLHWHGKFHDALGSIAKQVFSGGFLKNPIMYFCVIAASLMGMLCFNTTSLAQLTYVKKSPAVFLSGVGSVPDIFANQNDAHSLETPDLKIIQNDFVYGITTPHALSPQTLGALMGGPGQNSTEISDYVVKDGDTIQSVAEQYHISADTVRWANNLAAGASLKSGQALIILPVSGLLHVVKSGDTVIDIAAMYKANANDIVSFNNLADQTDVFVGDILIVPGGIMPKKPMPVAVQTPLPGSFFIYPVEGRITQGLHFFNGVDIANKVGTPVHAAAAGVVQRARYGWNFGGGNYVTIMHANGVVTYYGHMEAILVKPGDQVYVGQTIGLVGQTGLATGPHVHFQVIGAKNPFNFPVGTVLKYK